MFEFVLRTLCLTGWGFHVKPGFFITFSGNLYFWLEFCALSDHIPILALQNVFAGVSRERWSSAWRGQVDSLAKMLAWCDWEIEGNWRSKDVGDMF